MMDPEIVNKCGGMASVEHLKPKTVEWNLKSAVAN